MKLEMISKYPAGERHPTPLLFIHGTLHTALCWDEHFLDYFAQHGYAAHAVNLRGHGKSEGREKLRWTRIADFVEDVENAVRQLPSPTILIGHSMGDLSSNTIWRITMSLRLCCCHPHHLPGFYRLPFGLPDDSHGSSRKSI